MALWLVALTFLSPKNVIAIRTKRHAERRLDLVVFLEGYLVIARVTIEEGEQFIAGGGVYNLVYLR